MPRRRDRHLPGPRAGPQDAHRSRDRTGVPRGARTPGDLTLAARLIDNVLVSGRSPARPRATRLRAGFAQIADRGRHPGGVDHKSGRRGSGGGRWFQRAAQGAAGAHPAVAGRHDPPLRTQAAGNRLSWSPPTTTRAPGPRRPPTWTWCWSAIPGDDGPRPPRTVHVTTDEMLVLTKAARRGVDHALLVADLAFGSYEGSDEQAIATANRFVKEAGADAVKLERGDPIRSAGQGHRGRGHPGDGPRRPHPAVGHLARWLPGPGPDRRCGTADRSGGPRLQDAGCFSSSSRRSRRADGWVDAADEDPGHRYRRRSRGGRPGAGLPRSARAAPRAHAEVRPALRRAAGADGASRAVARSRRRRPGGWVPIPSTRTEYRRPSSPRSRSSSTRPPDRVSPGPGWGSRRSRGPPGPRRARYW